MNPYPHQIEGRDWLAAHRRGYLADACGLGKTVQAFLALEPGSRALVVTTASSVPQWWEEQETWARGWLDLTVLSYASPLLARLPVSEDTTVILDEAHYVKNPLAKRTKNTLRIARQAERTWMLGATPMPNHPGELWAPMLVLRPEVMGPYRRYRDWLDTFCEYYRHPTYGVRVHGVRNAALFRELIAPVMLRRSLADVGLNLPPLRVTLHMLENDGTFEAALEAADVDAERLRRMIEHEEDPDNGWSAPARLRRLVGEWKTPRVADILADELERGEYKKIVVVYHHRKVGDHFLGRLAPFGVRRIDGRTSIKERASAVADFRGPVRVLLAQDQAAGEALNLQAASEMALVEPPWTPDHLIQLVGRVHRIGQDHPCRARVFGVAGTMDVGLMRTLARKAQMKRSVGLA